MDILLFSKSMGVFWQLKLQQKSSIDTIFNFDDVYFVKWKHLLSYFATNVELKYFNNDFPVLFYTGIFCMSMSYLTITPRLPSAICIF
jgi:hypothetical protein